MEYNSILGCGVGILHNPRYANQILGCLFGPRQVVTVDVLSFVEDTGAFAHS